jgi:hypothetical protein
VIWVALFIGTWNTSAVLLLWWLAALNGWSARISFNHAGEGLAEGVLLHLSLLAVISVAMYEGKRSLDGYIR